MALFAKFASRALPRNESNEEAKWRRLSLTNGAGWAAFFGHESFAGKTVTNHAALQLATVFACIRIVAQAVGVMPMSFYRKDATNGRVEISDYPVAELTTRTPNADQTPQEFWEGEAAWLSANGNSFAEKVFIGSRVVALRPYPSHCVLVERDRETGLLVYRVNDRGKQETLPASKILHIRGFGFGGDIGLSPIRYGVQTLGSAIATEETSAKFFANGMQASGVLSSEQVLKKEQRDQLEKIMTKFVGSSNAGKMMILEAGLKYQQLVLNPEDAQMLETRRFSVEEICRWFGVPPMLVGHSAQGQTMWGSGIEQLLIAWLVLGLNPYLTRIEQRIDKDLIPPADRGKVYAEFNREALLQADSAAKATFLSTMVNNGLMTRREGRGKMNLPRKPGDDILTVQAALVPLDKLGQQPAAQPAKAAP